MDNTLKRGHRNIPQLHTWLGPFNQSNVALSPNCVGITASLLVANCSLLWL